MYFVEGDRIKGMRIHDKVNGGYIGYNFTYNSNNEVETICVNNEYYYYERDITKNINKILDSNGNVVVSYRYDAWGNVLEEVVTNSNLRFNPFLYKGYVYDRETKLYWVTTRYYSPELCRWISPDSIEYLEPSSINGLNLYVYCGNDPVNRFDPSGHFWDYVFDAIFIVWGVYDFIKEPSWSKAGWLALDIVLAIVPFIPTISTARHLGKIDNFFDAASAINKIDNAGDVASALNKIDNVGDVAHGFKYADDVIDSGQEIGTYLLKNADGDVIYVGKGSRKRMMKSYDLKNASSWLYYPAKNADIALANEAYFISIYGGAQSMNAGTRLLNKINSPGLRRLFWWF